MNNPKCLYYIFELLIFVALLKKLKFLSKIALFPLAANTVAIPVTYFINSLPIYNEKTAVFTSGDDHITKDILPPPVVSLLVDFFMYVPVTLRQNLRGSQVDWYGNATGDTVVEQITDDKYQSVVLIGHRGGSTNGSYAATDRIVYTSEILKYKPKKKSGELVQHTCGVKKDRQKSLREIILKKPKKGFEFDYVVYPDTSYFVAWRELFRPTNEFRRYKKEENLPSLLEVFFDEHANLREKYKIF